MMPTLNERDGLTAIWPQIDTSLFDEIVVIDGGSTDGTVEFCRDHGITVQTQTGRGFPDAENFGYAHTKSDIIIVFSPDGNSLPHLLPEVCDKMRQGYDMVIVSRYLHHARSLDDNWKTAIGNRAVAAAISILTATRYTDTTVCYRGYRREAIARMRLHTQHTANWLRRNYWYMNSWEIAACMRAPRLGMRILEIPGDEPARIGGVTKVKLFHHAMGLLLQVIEDFLLFPWFSR